MSITAIKIKSRIDKMLTEFDKTKNWNKKIWLWWQINKLTEKRARLNQIQIVESISKASDY